MKHPVLLLLALGLCAPVAEARPAAPRTIAGALLEQQALPALRARTDAANARTASGEAWFTGELPLSAAFPDLADAPIDDAAYLYSSLKALQDAAEARAAERIAPPPEGLLERDAQRWTSARDAACDAEDRADATRHRLLSGLRASTSTATGLSGAAIEASLANIRAQRAALPQSPDDPDWADRVVDVQRWGDAEAALQRYRTAARRAATIPGDTTLADLVTADTVALERTLSATVLPAPLPEDHGRADRITRALPLLTGPTQRRADIALQSWNARATLSQHQLLLAEITRLTEVRGALGEEILEASPDIYVAQSEVARAARVAAESAVQALTADTPTETRAVAEAELQVAVLRSEIAQRRTRRARSLAELGLSTTATTADVDAARAAAAAAEASAQAAEKGDPDGQLRADLARYRTLQADLLDEETTRHQAALEVLEDRRQSLATRAQSAAAARAQPPSIPGRQQRLDQAWRDLRALVDTLRADLEGSRGSPGRRDVARSIRDDSETQLANLPTTKALVAEDEALLQDVNDALTTLTETLASREEHALNELDATLGLLEQAQQERRQMRPQVSTEALSAASSDFLPELIQEAREVPLRVSSLTRRGTKTARDLPGMLLDLSALWGVVTRSFEFILLVLFWSVLRERSGSWWERTTLRLQTVRRNDKGLIRRIVDQLQPRIDPGDWTLLQPTGTRALALSLDAIAAGLLVALLGDRLALLTLLARVWLYRSLILLWPLLTRLALGSPGAPAIRRVSSEARVLASRTVRVILIWELTRRLLSWTALALLDADRISDMIDGIAFGVGWVIAAVLLSAWAPAVREAVSEGEEDRLTTLLTRPTKSPVLAAPQAAAGLIVLMGRLASNVASRLVEQRAGLAWLGAALARQRLREDDADPRPPLPPDLAEKVAVFSEPQLAYADETEALHAAYQSWATSRRRGMVAVTGDRGSGKSRFLRRACEELEGHHPVQHLTIDNRIERSDDARRWLASQIGLPESAAASNQSLELALNTLSPKVFVLDDVHLLFVRAVGGFSALRSLLGVMHATSEEHFWVCALHGPAWWYLEGVAEAVNLAVFRARITLEPLDATQLGDWLEEHTLVSGIAPNFDHLIRDNLLGGDPERARQRARLDYWRLLASASNGNPRVALGYWCTSLRMGDAAGHAIVSMFSAPRSKDIERASDRELFVLTALVIHDGLRVEELARVLNLPAGVCRATCRHLEARDILRGDSAGDQYSVRPPWLPAVERMLHQKHFLHER